MSLDAVPPPSVPTSAGWLSAHNDMPVTVAGQSGDRQWRVMAYQETFLTPGGPTTGTVLVAFDVTSVYRTLAALALIDLIVSGIVLVALAIVGIAIVRSSLRPLTDIEQTAQAIASGDLSQRVPDRDPRTEVGRLGRSLNAMLAQVEAAFHAREKSEAAARRSEERMRQFVADASHELRTPLTAIRGYAEYYRQRGGMGNGARHAAPPAEPSLADGSQLTEPDLDRIMQRVEQESARMGVLVEDMLLLARLDQQRPIERRPVALKPLLDPMLEDQAGDIAARGLTVTLDLAVAEIMSERQGLQEALANLLSNAVKFSPAQGGTISVRSYRDGDQVVVAVADCGVGFDMQYHDRIFGIFERLHRQEDYPGTGVGLAIVRKVAERHGGRAWAESALGQGSTFFLALPDPR